MKSFVLQLDQGAKYVLLAVLMMIASVFLPIMASAAQITTRSVALSSSAKSATGVSYAFTFTTAESTAGAVVIQFCSNSPLIGADCTAPTGFTSAAATATGGATISGTPSANKVIVTTNIEAGVNTFTLGTITNPSATGALYARVVTYLDASAAASYSTNGQTLGSSIDDGSMAIYINDNVNVSGAVLETLTFCVSGGVSGSPATNPIGANCTGTLTAPTLVLGKTTSGVVALDSTEVSQGTIYTQLSTNAVNGVVVSLKSNATDCGGLIRSSDPAACDIKPAGITDPIIAGEAKFGLKLGANVSDPTDGDLVASTNYNDTDFQLNYVAGNGTGVTSTYGDPILSTSNKPANNRDMPITFGASVANNTPAGNYSAVLSLVATGKF